MLTDSDHWPLATDHRHDQSPPRYARPAAARYSALEFCRGRCARRLSRLQLPGNPYADFRDRRTCFARGVGEETDIVAKEMFTWEDRGRAESDKGQSLTLRPENTAGVVRAYIEHKLWERGLNKLYYIGPQFRRERPQKGRYRQFYQIGAEVIGPSTAGSESPARDAGDSRNARDVARSSRASQAGRSNSTRLVAQTIAPHSTRPCATALEPVDVKNVRRLSAPRRDESASSLRLQSAGRPADHRNATAHQPVPGRILPPALPEVKAILQAVGVHLPRKRPPSKRLGLLQPNCV